MAKKDWISAHAKDFVKASRFHHDFFRNLDDCETWNEYINNYNAWRQRADQPTTTDPIPRKIHQIWIGDPPSQEIERLRASWKAKMPHYEYKLWSDQNIKSLDFPLKELYLRLENPGAKSDVARYSILALEGGIYADTDMECVASLDNSLRGASFLCGHMPGPSDAAILLGNSLIASIPQHAIINQIIKELEALESVNEADGMEIIKATGPGLFTKAASEAVNDPSVTCLPSNYLYPWPDFLKDYPGDPHIFLEDYSLCIHHWHCSWMGHSQRSSRKLEKLKRLTRRIKSIGWSQIAL